MRWGPTSGCGGCWLRSWGSMRGRSWRRCTRPSSPTTPHWRPLRLLPGWVGGSDSLSFPWRWVTSSAALGWSVRSSGCLLTRGGSGWWRGRGRRGWARPPWPSTPPTGWPSGSATASCMWTCMEPPPVWRRLRLWRCLGGSCGRWAWTLPRFPPVWRRAVRPTWPVSALAERLADARRLLDELELAEVGVRASFTVSVEQLRAGDGPVDRAAAEAFGLLGLLDGPDVGVPVAARLLDNSEERAERVLERLVDAQLLETPTPGRYRLHDLLRLYARELASRRYAQPVLAAALTRALGFYVATAWHTLALLRPGDYRLQAADDRWCEGGLKFADEQAALGWLEAERPNLLAAVGQAAATPGVHPEIAIQLAQALFGYFCVRSHWEDCVQASQTALETARRIGDRAAQARAYNDLGGAYLRRGQYDRALGNHQPSLALYRKLGDRAGEAETLNELGVVYQRQGRYREALACHEESLALRRELNQPHGEAESLRELGMTLRALGRAEEARAHWLDALAILQRLQTTDADQVRVVLAEESALRPC